MLKVEGIESRARVEERHKYGNPLQLFLPGESHGQRSLADCEESDRTEHTHTQKATNRNNYSRTPVSMLNCQTTGG